MSQGNGNHYIASRPATEAYRDNWMRIFRKDVDMSEHIMQQEMRRNRFEITPAGHAALLDAVRMLRDID